MISSLLSSFQARPAIGEQTALSSSFEVFYAQTDDANNQRVNFFDDNGELRYTATRNSLLSKIWVFANARNGAHVAVVTAGVLTRSVDFVNKPGLQHREIEGSLFSERRFHLNDGASYAWNASSLYLERIVNPGGGHEEIRQRLGRARLLRGNTSSYEILVDRRFDAEIALATALIAMRTQWWIQRKIVPGVRTPATHPVTVIEPRSDSTGNAITEDAIQDPVRPARAFADISNVPASLLVYNKEEAGKPRDFFNPPSFLDLPRQTDL